MWKLTALTVIAYAILHVSEASPVYTHEANGLSIDVSDTGPSRTTRSVTLSNRTLCGEGDDPPSNRVDTSERNAELIIELKNAGYDAYIIPTGDDHQSEYPASRDRGRAYITGFSGSAGTAVVLTNGTRALWTDGRYFLQADEQLDCDWILMKSGLPGVPTIEEFLTQNLDSSATVSADAKLLGYSTWLAYEKPLIESGIGFVPSDDNLVNLVWDEDTDNPRPAYSDDNAIVHDIIYAGKSATEKLADVRNDFQSQKADGLFITALDEVAWLYNIRGGDVPYNPVIRSYSFVNSTDAILYVDLQKITNEVMIHLTDSGVTVANYTLALSELESLSSAENITIMLPDNSFTPGCSYEVYQKVPETNRLMSVPPTLTMKAAKNSIEIQQMKLALIHDGVAVCDFLAFLESEIALGNPWTEISAQNKLNILRSEQDNFMDLSFSPISAYGPHGSVIHYGSTEDTNVVIKNESLYMLDSGGQYLGATTDITRTVHFGIPTDEMIQMYTNVLIGSIDFGTVVFPDGTTGGDIDILARRAIYAEGLDYRHGTSHGIGMYLNVHEPKPSVYKPGFVMSDEPGYYKDNEWGIRIENQVYVVDTGMKFDEPFYTFEFLSLVPFDPKLIDVSMLNSQHISWLNNYYTNIRENVGQMMLDQNRTEGYDWLFEKTEAITIPMPTAPVCKGGASGVSLNTGVFYIILVTVAGFKLWTL